MPATFFFLTARDQIAINGVKEENTCRSNSTSTEASPMPKVTSNYPGTIDFPTATEGPFENIIYGEPCSLEISYNSDLVPADGPYEYLTNGGADGYIDLLIADENYISTRITAAIRDGPSFNSMTDNLPVSASTENTSQTLIMYFQSTDLIGILLMRRPIKSWPAVR